MQEQQRGNACMHSSEAHAIAARSLVAAGSAHWVRAVLRPLNPSFAHCSRPLP